MICDAAIRGNHGMICSKLRLTNIIFAVRMALSLCLTDRNTVCPLPIVTHQTLNHQARAQRIARIRQHLLLLKALNRIRQHLLVLRALNGIRQHLLMLRALNRTQPYR